MAVIAQAAGAAGDAPAVGEGFAIESVMATMARRIRAAKKKLSRVGDIESALTTGKAINDDQVGA